MKTNQPYLIIGEKESAIKYCINFCIKNILNDFKHIKYENFFNNSNITKISSNSSLYKKSDLENILNSLYLNSSSMPSIIIIEDAHLLGINNSQSFLTIFENIPYNTYFFLITNIPNYLPLTMQSRCIKYFIQNENKFKNKNFFEILLNKNISTKEVNNLINNSDFTEIEIKEIIENTISYLKKNYSSSFFSSKLENILKINILNFSYKNILKIIFMILH